MQLHGVAAARACAGGLDQGLGVACGLVGQEFLGHVVGVDEGGAAEPLVFEVFALDKGLSVLVCELCVRGLQVPFVLFFAFAVGPGQSKNGSGSGKRGRYLCALRLSS